jgi:hypothetical protein
MLVLSCSFLCENCIVRSRRLHDGDDSAPESFLSCIDHLIESVRDRDAKTIELAIGTAGVKPDVPLVIEAINENVDLVLVSVFAEFDDLLM